MSIGLVGLASVTSGPTQLVACDTGANTSNAAVRVFDLVLVNTAATVSFYAGTSTAGTKYITLDINNKDIHSNVGFRFIGGVFVDTTTQSGAMATISYIKEF